MRYSLYRALRAVIPRRQNSLQIEQQMSTILSSLPVIEALAEAVMALEDPHGWRVWRQLALALPAFGRYTLHAKVQRRAMDAFTRKYDDAYILPYGARIYCLPNGARHRGHDLYAYTSPETWNVLGSYEWWTNGLKHRENDQPAVIYSNGDKEWWTNGLQHRDNDQPAVIRKDGVMEWWKNGKRHRDNDLPADVAANGTLVWYKNGNMHRDNDRPADIHPDCHKGWYKNGRKHRDNDKPAVMYQYRNEWWIEGKIIRSDDFYGTPRHAENVRNWTNDF